jgi:uncharacterized protein (TIGR00369 family)
VVSTLKIAKATLFSTQPNLTSVPPMTKVKSRQLFWLKRLARTIPFYKHLGINLAKVSWGKAEIRLKVRKQLTQSVGFAHGGVSAALIDSAVGLALCSMLDQRELITTVSLNVNFIAPAGPGVLTARGRIYRKGRHLAVGDAEVRDERGTLVSTGSATYMMLGNKRKQL